MQILMLREINALISKCWSQDSKPTSAPIHCPPRKIFSMAQQPMGPPGSIRDGSESVPAKKLVPQSKEECGPQEFGVII